MGQLPKTNTEIENLRVGVGKPTKVDRHVVFHFAAQNGHLESLNLGSQITLFGCNCAIKFYQNEVGFRIPQERLYQINSIKKFQKYVEDQPSGTVITRVRSCVSSTFIRCTPILIWSFSKESSIWSILI